MAKAEYKKRADGRYMAQITIGLDPKTGRPIKKTVYGKNLAELRSKKAHIRADLERGTYSDDKGITVARYAEKWYELNMPGKSESSKARYRNLIKNHMNYLGALKLSAVTKSDIQMELNQLQDRLETQRCLLMTLKQIFESAIDDHLISQNPCRNIRLPAIEREEKEPLSDFELQCIEETDLNLRERCFVSLLLYTGMRKGEVLALNRKDINLRTNQIHVWRSVEYAGEQPILKEPKTRAGIRDIPILSTLRPVLVEYLKQHKEEYLFERDGKLLTKSSDRSMWNTIYRKLSDTAGCQREISATKKVVYLYDPLKGLTRHRFRHNFATTLYYAGVDVKEAARILGHSNIKITLEIYTHLEAGKSTAADKLEAYYLLQNP